MPAPLCGLLNLRGSAVPIIDLAQRLGLPATEPQRRSCIIILQLALPLQIRELGMLVDLSHTGERTFWDAMAITTRPVIASHSCAWSLCPVFRNMKDDQIKAVGENGGVILMHDTKKLTAATIAQLLDEALDLQAGARVEPRRRLVEEEERRAREDGPGDGDLLLHAAAHLLERT